jgi:site-specific recombinase XerD
MSDISRNADCSRIYTPHFLRATAIQRMNDAGYQIRHIMHMSGHKDEG